MAGKGDRPRPLAIERKEYERRWERTFKKGDRAEEEEQDGARDRTEDS